MTEVIRQPSENAAFMFPVGDRQIVVGRNPQNGGLSIAFYKRVETERPPQTREERSFSSAQDRVRQVVKDTVTKAFLPAVGLGVAVVVGNNVLHPSEYQNLAEFARVNFPLFAQVTAPALIGLSTFIRESNNATVIRQKWPVVTAGLVALNTLAYIAGQVNPEVKNWLFNPVTAPFVHADSGHLVNNMTQLAFLGTQVERRMGSGKMLLTYLLSSVSGNTIHVLTGDPTIGIGASGGDFGLLGATIIGALSEKKGGKTTALTTGAALLLAQGQFSGIGSQFGHVSGLVTGTLAGIGNWVGEKLKPRQTTVV